VREMVQARKEQLQKKGVSGFTLMEMLIVVAIIAVLVAIAIPVFSAQLGSARAETDAANIRSGYASATVTVLNSGTTTATKYYLQSDGSVTTTASGSYECKGNASDLSDKDQSIGGTKASSIAWTASKHIEYDWDGSAMTIKVAA
jgi:type IV pilus assembly protein PilA